MKTTWFNRIDTRNISSLDQFNGMLRDYVRNYNTSHHSGIDASPMDRFHSTGGNIRHPESREWLDECFYNREIIGAHLNPTYTESLVCAI